MAIKSLKDRVKLSHFSRITDLTPTASSPHQVLMFIPMVEAVVPEEIVPQGKILTQAWAIS